MFGSFTRDPNASFELLLNGKVKSTDDFECILTVHCDDLNKMLKDENHESRLSGTVRAPTLSSEPMTLAGGIFELFVVYPQCPDARQMRYQFAARSVEGRTYYIDGYKLIQNAPIFKVWHDTTTLRITIYDRPPDEPAVILGRGVLRLTPPDFLRELGTIGVSNAKNPFDRLCGIARYGGFFVGTLQRYYGGLTVRPCFKTVSRIRRPLLPTIAEFYPVTTEDKWQLKLTRYPGGKKGPVMLVHGLGVSSLIFSTDLVKPNLVEFLVERGYDVWLLDFRVSTALDYATMPSNGDEVARYDYPAAIDKILSVTKADDIQCVVHCWGATTFLMSMLKGLLPGVRSFVSSQIGLYSFCRRDVSFKPYFHLPGILDRVGVTSLDAYARADEPWVERFYDKALQAYAMRTAQGRCASATCHRITFMYGSLYEHDQLDVVLHANLHELFGASNMRAFEHIAKIIRSGYLVDFDENNVYLPNLKYLDLPIAFIHGAENHCFLPEGTKKTFETLCDRFGPKNYSRHVIEGYGHIDCIFGKNAHEKVYPLIVAHLDAH